MTIVQDYMLEKDGIVIMSGSFKEMLDMLNTILTLCVNKNVGVNICIKDGGLLCYRSTYYERDL